MKRIDHFMYAGSSLSALEKHFSELTGIQPEQGGSHPSLGTRNSLVGTDSASYLELIAPDPGLDARSDMRNAFETLSRPQLYRFIMLCDSADFPALTQAYEDEGIAAPVYDLQRITPAGDTLRWKLMIPASNTLGLFAPFFIDWLDSPHPSTRLAPSACAIAGCEAGHPDYDRVARLWNRLGVGIPLVRSDAAHMRLVLDTPRGRVALTASSEGEHARPA